MRLEKIANLICMMGIALLLLLPPNIAWAHVGAPIVVLRDVRLGAYTVERLLADPDVGGGTFEVRLAVEGESPPADTRVWFVARPLDEHTEALREEARRREDDPRTFVALLPFDAEGEWHVTMRIEGPAGDAEYGWTIRVTPPGGFSPASLLCLMPFAAAALLWWWGSRRAQEAQATSET